MQVIFGPVKSRRFGESLGVDLSPQTKQCNYDCLYCELKGKKAQDSMSEVLSCDFVLEEIQKGLEKFKNIESLTITANGEPTLYPHLYELMLRLWDIKGDVKTLLLTNGALLQDACVSRACLLFDKVKFSLDAVSGDVFKKIDRPVKGVDLEKILSGIYAFSADFTGELYAEILFVKGVNDDLEEVKKMAKFLSLMRLKRLDIGTIDRPPAYRVDGISKEKLEEIAKIFLAFNVPLSLPTREATKKQNLSLNKEALLKTLALRPQSVEDVKMLWDSATQRILAQLVESRAVEIVKNNGVSFYKLKDSSF